MAKKDVQSDEPIDDTSISIFSNRKDGLISKNKLEFAEQIKSITNEKGWKIAPHKRKQTSTVYTEKKDLVWGNNIGIRFELERKVEGLPSIFMNKMQHSGTHFFSTRFSALSYGNMKLDDGAYFAYSEFPKFFEGGIFAMCELYPNQYNIIRLQELIEKAKVILYFRDPRSIMVSAVHLIYRKGQSAEEVYIESLGNHPGGIIPVEFKQWSIEKRLEYYILNFFDYWASFVNDWYGQIKSFPDDTRKKLMICEFKQLRNSGGTLFSDILNFADLPKFASRIPKDKDLPSNMWNGKISNSHFRKGLLDEWKTACTPEQIKWMTKKINPEAMEFFEWDRES